MLAFVVEIDGNPVTRAGVEDWSLLTFTVVASRDKGQGRGDHMELRIGGLTLSAPGSPYNHVRWGEPETSLSIGNQVALRIVDTDSVDAPTHRYRSDQLVQESPFTEEEIRIMRYKDYLELKKEFEPEAAE